jgi:hypothetical protein
MGRFFSPSQKSLAKESFAQAEKLAGQFFHLSSDSLKSYRYDIRTLAYLEKHEVNEKAFAHLCKYHYRNEHTDDAGFHFYRICLQDNCILDAIDRAGSFIKLSPLMLYIAAHELIHVIRFDSGLVDFDAPSDLKREEEERVNLITREMLRGVRTPDMNIVFECFSKDYQIGDMHN